MCDFHYHNLLLLHTNCWTFLCRIGAHGALFYLCTLSDLSHSVTYPSICFPYTIILNSTNTDKQIL
jgi:hypothetical protein